MYKAEALFDTTLSADIDSVQITIPVSDINKFPSDFPNVATIINPSTEELETIEYTGKSGNELTGVTRGVEGTAQPWSNGDIIGRYHTAKEQNDLVNDYVSHRDNTNNPHNTTALKVDYDNSKSSYTATNVQDIIDEIAGFSNTHGIKVTDTGSDFVVERVGDDVTQADFDTISPWQDMRRCNLADDLTVNAYYGDPTFAYDGSNGQVMVEIPQFYWKAYRLSDTEIIYLVSDIQRDGFELYPAFKSDEGTYENLYIGAFEATLYDNSAGTYVGDGVTYDYTNDVMASVAGYQPISGNSDNLDITQARQLAENRGSGWSLQYYTAREAINLLFYIEYADFNSQSILSGGITNLDSGTGNHSQNTGHTTGLGNNSGEVSITPENGATGAATTYPFSYRGIENYWGNIWEFVDGINIRDNEPYISNNDFQSDLFSEPYSSLGRTLPSSNGYGSGQVLDTDIGLSSLPISLNGSSSSYYCDYYYQNTGDRIAQVGAYWADGSYSGLAYWYLVDVSATSYRVISSRCFAKS